MSDNNGLSSWRRTCVFCSGSEWIGNPQPVQPRVTIPCGEVVTQLDSRQTHAISKIIDGDKFDVTGVI